MYLYQSYESRDQSWTLLKSVSAIDFLQLGQGRHPRYIHPTSFSSFPTLNCCKITLVGFRSSGRYSHQSSASRDQLWILVKTISSIDLPQLPKLPIDFAKFIIF